MPAEACASQLPSASGVGCMDLLSVRRITHLDLFSGIGGFALAAQAAGFSTVGFSEIEPYACKILKRHWPNVPNHGDIRNIKSVRADLVTGGFPCQPYSLAGQRRGAADDRALWPEMLRVIGESECSCVLGENVAGIINMELDRVLTDLEAIGYAAWSLVVPACAVDARHRRDRIWIVAYSESNDRRRRLRKTATEQNGHQPANGGATLADNDGTGISQLSRTEGGWSGARQSRGESLQGNEPARWMPEPGVGRVANGIPNRPHRLRGLGNSIVPQVAETLIREMARTLNASDQRPATL